MPPPKINTEEVKKYKEAREWFNSREGANIGYLSEEDSICLVEFLYLEGAKRVDLLYQKDDWASEVIVYFAKEDLAKLMDMAIKSEPEKIFWKNGVIKIIW
jgi:hypothetical protein